jgi:hypothetical protein
MDGISNWCLATRRKSYAPGNTVSTKQEHEWLQAGNGSILNHYEINKKKSVYVAPPCTHSMKT